MIDWITLQEEAKRGHQKALARLLSLIENEVAGYEQVLSAFDISDCSGKIIGITGPPGAGKSTLVNALLASITAENKRVAVLCIDPSSPFHQGALLGDRIRMNQWQSNPLVFIRSLASRGSVGGLNPMIMELTDMLLYMGFDKVIIETVGIGQSEIEISKLADVTVVVLVPESGDDIQVIKSGMMEIADIFVVNKFDRPQSNILVEQLQAMLAEACKQTKKLVPVCKTIASSSIGIPDLWHTIEQELQNVSQDKKVSLIAERAYFLIQKNRMKDIQKKTLYNMIANTSPFRLYEFVKQFCS